MDAAPGAVRRYVARFAMTVGLAIAFVLLDASVASAHAQLETTTPVQGSVVLFSPPRVTMHFDEAVQIDLGSVRVLGPDSKRVDEGGTYHPGGVASSIAVNLPPNLPAGTYIVAWRVVSDDSHPVHGAFIFSVGTDAGAAKADALATTIAGASGSPTVAIVFWLLRVLLFGALALLVGVAVIVAALWPAGTNLRRVRRLVLGSWIVLAVVSILEIGVQGVNASALPITDLLRPSLLSAVISSRFGEVALARVGLLVLAIPVLLAMFGRRPDRRARRWWIPVGALLGLAVLVTPGLAGHAATGTAVALGLPIDVLHLLAISLWLGGIAVLACLLVPGAALGLVAGTSAEVETTDEGATATVLADPRVPEVGRIALGVSRLSFIAVCVVIVTGTIQSLRQVGSWSGLVDTEYGVTLLVKIALVAVMIGVGALSRRSLHGRLLGSSSGARRPAQLDRLRRTVLMEIALAVAVLGVTAGLVNAPPSRQVQAQPFSETWQVLGVQVNAIVAPSAAGPGNEFHFYVLGRTGAPQAIPELQASIRLPAAHIGPIDLPLHVVGPGHYSSTQIDLPAAGTWRLKVTVRTTATAERTVFAVLPVR